MVVHHARTYFHAYLLSPSSSSSAHICLLQALFKEPKQPLATLYLVNSVVKEASRAGIWRFYFGEFSTNHKRVFESSQSKQTCDQVAPKQTRIVDFPWKNS